MVSRTSVTARGVALQLLTAVDERDAYANLELPRLLASSSLSARDRGFATELGYGTLRMRGLYRAILDTLVTAGVTSLDGQTLRILELGAHQMLTLKTPAHAVVNESVSLARSSGSARSSGLVNAVLRKLAAHDSETWKRRVSEGSSDLAGLAIRTSHPEWVVHQLKASLAREGKEDELESVLAANNEPAAVSLVLLPTASDTSSVKTPSATDFDPGRWSVHARRSAGGSLRDLPSGVRVQDEGSQLVAATLAHARVQASTEHWLDACAGPGGKAAYLAAEASRAGADLTARDVNPTRVKLVQNALDEAGVLARVEVGDARELAQSPRRFHRILLDVPCTGLGALRRRPEARWRKQPEDMRELRVLQREILDAGLRSMEPGGVLMYATCSPVVDETTSVLQDVLATHPEIVAEDTFAVLQDWLQQSGGSQLPDGAVPGSFGGTAVQLWPHRHDTDAMFFQLLRRLG